MKAPEQLLEEARAALAGHEGDEAELAVVSGRQAMSRSANSVVHQSMETEDVLFVARVVREGRIGAASAHGFDGEAPRRALADAAELARFAPSDPAFRGLPEPAATPDLVTAHDATRNSTHEQRAAAWKRAFDRAGRDGLSVAGALGVLDQVLVVANTRGVAQAAPLTSAAANLIATGDSSSGYASNFARDIKEIDLDNLAETAVRKALAAATPRTIEPGSYEVILEPTAVAELMEWFTYTSFSARGMAEKTSSLAGRLGEPITGERITIVDDATDEEGLPTPFDFEGVPKRRQVLIENGVARGFARDSVWAHRMGDTPTGHAWLRSGDDPDPVPMNLFLESGDTPVSELAAGVERGLLVTRFHYVNGFLDTRRALMTGMTRDGTFLIEDGKIRGGVGNLRFTQSMLDAFRDVRAISRERQRIPAWWSNASNTGALTMPTLHLGSFRFTGRQEGLG